MDKQHFVIAGESWRRVIALDPHNYRWHLEYSDMLGNSAVADNNNRQLRMAEIGELRKSIAILRNQPRAWARLAEVHRQIGEPAQADAIYKEYFGDETPAETAARQSGAASGEAIPIPRKSASPAGLALAVILLLVVGMAWLRHTFTVWRRERMQSGKKKEVIPDRLHELIGAAGGWSIAVAVPYASVLLGVGRAPGELRELMLHLIPGVAALVLAIAYASRPYQRGGKSGDLYAVAPFVTFVTSLVAIVVHLPDLFSAGEIRATGSVLVHLAPLVAMFVLVTLSISQRPPSAAPIPRPAKESVDIA